MDLPPRVTIPAVLFSVLAACASPEDGALAPPRFDVLTQPVISGSVLGPAGSICNSLPDGTVLLVRLFTPGAAGFSDISNPVCPDNTYAFSVDPGTYLLRVALPPDSVTLGALPWRTITPAPIVVESQDVTQDLLIAPGTPLGGHATFDGAPVPNVSLTLVYDAATNFATATAFSGANGAWTESFGRTPPRLQDGVRLQALLSCLDPFSSLFLGSRQIAGPPAGGFLFPGEVSAIDCSLTTAPTAQFSHDRTPLVVTPMPGDIGGLSPELFDQFGAGWGVQLLGPGETPQHASITRSQLFRGGLIVGLRPDRVLSGIGLDGYTDCGASCRDFGLDGTMSQRSTPLGRRVTWRYSDAPSPEAVGLRVGQTSFDEPLAKNAVLFRYSFTNTGPSTLTFYAGVFMDWDVGNADFDAFDDVGFTGRAGRLMYMANADGTGPVDGTVILGAPVSGNAFLTDFFQSTATVVATMAGEFQNPSIAAPGDHRYIHAVGPIVLGRGQSRDIWVAVVSAPSATDLSAKVDAATAAVGRLTKERESGWGEGTGFQVTPGPHRASGSGRENPRCKRGCDRF